MYFKDALYVNVKLSLLGMLHFLVVVNHSTNEGTSSNVLNDLTIVLITTCSIIASTETVTQTTAERFTVKADLNCTPIALALSHRAVHVVLKDLLQVMMTTHQYM